jgi:hypothetical protein
VVVDHLQEAFVSRLVLAQLPLVRDTDCLSTPRGGAADTTASDACVVVVSGNAYTNVAGAVRR